MGKNFYVYILECSDGSLYCGYATDLEARIKTHNDGKGAKYTRGRLPVKVIFSEMYETKSQALKCEIEIKNYQDKKN